MGNGHAVTPEGHLEDGVSAGVDEPQAGFIPRSGIKRSVRPGNASVDEVVRIHHIAGIPAQSQIGRAVGHHAPLTTHIHPAVATHVHVSVSAHVHPRQHGQLIFGTAAVDAVQPVVEHDGPLDVLVLSVLRVTDDQRGVQTPVEL